MADGQHTGTGMDRRGFFRIVGVSVLTFGVILPAARLLRLATRRLTRSTPPAGMACAALVPRFITT